MDRILRIYTENGIILNFSKLYQDEHGHMIHVIEFPLVPIRHTSSEQCLVRNTPLISPPLWYYLS